MTRTCGRAEQVLARGLGMALRLSFAVALALRSGFVSAAEPADPAALMELLAQVQRVEVAYEETLESGLLDVAVGSRGRLEYQAPDRMRRVSEHGDGFDLDGERVRLFRGGESSIELAVSEVPPLQAVIGALRACFAGDLATLQAGFRLDYQPRERDWALVLEPREGPAARILRRLELRGSGSVIRSVEVLEADGDRRLLRLRLLAREPALPD